MRSLLGMMVFVVACGGSEPAPAAAPAPGATAAVPASARVDVDLETFAAA
jgi:hypothetical protein